MTGGQHYVLFPTPLGWMGLVGSSKGLRRLILPQASYQAALPLTGKAASCSTLFGDLPQLIQRYLEGEKVSFSPRLDLRGFTPFQRKVWRAVRRIPYGETRSYSWVARQIGKPRAARAVGQALASNPLPILIPCHRVVASGGELGGYSGGLELKAQLLRLEAASSEYYSTSVMSKASASPPSASRSSGQ